MKPPAPLIALLGGGLALLQCAASAPPEERDAIDFNIPAAGVPSNWLISSGTGKLADAYVILAGPPTASGTIAGPTTLMGWTRTGKGDSGWEWTGPIEVPGLPPAIPTTFSSRSVISNGMDEIAFTRQPNLMCVLRRVNGTWEYRGDIAYSFSSSYVNSQPVRAIDGDTAIVRQPPSPMSVFRRQPNGTWAAAGTFSGGGTVLLSGSKLVYGGVDIDFFYPFLNFGFRDGVLQPDGSVVVHPVHAAPVTYPQQFANFKVTDGTWVAASVSAFANPAMNIALYRYQPDGMLVQTQYLLDVGTRPADLRNGRMVTSNAVWAVDAGGQWHRGAELTPDAYFWGPPTISELGVAGLRHFISGEDVVCLTTTASNFIVPTLRVWKNVFDCDANGVDDALEIALNPALDCNMNGRKDSCDIADGILLDANGNGTPDVCEPDCDGNGVPDITQIRSGEPASCDGSTLAVCEIAAGATDSDGDGRIDMCGPDLNFNGVPDLLELANGKAQDCDGNGVPDDAPAYRVLPSLEPPGGVGFTHWGQAGIIMCESFVTDAKQSTLTGISFGIQPSDTATVDVQVNCGGGGRPITVAIARDPNGDGKPSDAEVVAYASGVSTTEHWQTLHFDPITIDTPIFFAIYTLGPRPGSDCIDLDCGLCAPTYEAGYANCKRLFWNGFYGDAPTDYQAAIRSCRVEALGESYAVPISVLTTVCGNPADFNHDGFVDGFDLGFLLGAWGPSSGSVCDMNHDASVDGADLGMLIAAWGRTGQ